MVESLVKKHNSNRKYFLATTDVKDCIKSNWEHPKEHIFRQLEYFKHSKGETDIKASIQEVLRTMNSYRFLNGADNPVNGVWVSKMRPYLLCLFTDDNSIKDLDMNMFENKKASIMNYSKSLFRDDITMQIYVFTNTPKRWEHKCRKKLSELKQEYGIDYIIVDSFTTFKKLFQANIHARVDIKNKWMSEKHIRYEITPTLTMKATLVNQFDQMDDDNEEIEIIKVNIAAKFTNNNNQNTQERKYEHLENWGEATFDKGSKFDFWPIPNEKIVSQNQESLHPREPIQTLFMKKTPLNFLDDNYFNEINDKAIFSLFDSIDRIFSLNSIQNLYDCYQITSTKFLKNIISQGIWPEKWLSNPNYKDCKPMFFECSISGDTCFQPFGLVRLTRRVPKIPLDNVLAPIDHRKSTELLKIPFQADLIILPLNFTEFIALLRVREKIEKQSNKEYYLKAWRTLLEKYLAGIPFYYRYYINAALNFMKYNESQLLKNRRAVATSDVLNERVKLIKEEQGNQRINREKTYLINLKSHKGLVFGDFPDWCKSLRCFLPKTTPKTQAKLQQARDKSNLSLLDPFSFNRKDITLTVAAIANEFEWKLSLEPQPDLNKWDISQDILEHEKDIKKKFIAEDDHQKPIFWMGHVQAFRDYPVLKSIHLTDNEFKMYTDISFGNLFTTAIKSKYHTAQATATSNILIDESEAQEVESVFVFDNIEEALTQPPKIEQINKVKDIEIPVKQMYEEIKTHPSEKDSNSEKFEKDSQEPTRMKVEKKEKIKKSVSKDVFKKSVMSPTKNSSSNVPSTKVHKKSSELSSNSSLDILSLVEEFYRENSDLIISIKTEMLHIAGDLKLQKLLKSWDLKRGTLTVSSQKCQKQVCSHWPIFNQVKPRAVQKLVMDRSFRWLRKYNI